MSSQSYRPDIDGLRAIAVLSVIFFHFDIGMVRGGFIGVDIFFVISGFLITRIIARELDTGSFSLRHFYERRILRIFPALFAMLFVTTIAGYAFLFPPDYKYFGQVLSAAGVFASNIIFWKESGYFEADSFTIPLLHTWSLAVEEQFYIFFPLIMMGIYRFGRRALRPLIIAGFLLSFAVAAIAAHLGMTAILFYMLPTRAWELLVGSILALGMLPDIKKQNLVHILSLIGFGLIAYATFFFHGEMVFPGPSALVPTIGAALIIYARTGIANRVLSLRPVVFTGRISYSLYLWHWPLIVFVKYASPIDISGGMSILLIVILFGISYLSWRWIEQPARYQTRFSQKQIFLIAFILSVFFIVAGVGISKMKGFPDRFSPEIQNLYGVLQTGMELPTIADPNYPDSDHRIGVLGDAKAKADFLLWGDSHAGASLPGVNKAAKEAHRKGYFLNLHSCPPSVYDLPKYAASDDCNKFNARVVKFLAARPDIENIILIGHWSMHEKRLAREFKVRHLTSPDVLHDALDALMTEMDAQGRHVYFMIDPPHAPMENVPLYMARANFYGADMNLMFDLSGQEKRQEGMKVILKDLSRRHDFTLVDPAPLFCPNGVCSISKDGEPFYTDDNHLTRWASEHFYTMYKPFFGKTSGK